MVAIPSPFSTQATWTVSVARRKSRSTAKTVLIFFISVFLLDWGSWVFDPAQLNQFQRNDDKGNGSGFCVNTYQEVANFIALLTCLRHKGLALRNCNVDISLAIFADCLISSC
jgi:hypothetical protein